jgi:hypothetical protein
MTTSENLLSEGGFIAANIQVREDGSFVVWVRKPDEGYVSGRSKATIREAIESAVYEAVPWSERSLGNAEQTDSTAPVLLDLLA